MDEAGSEQAHDAVLEEPPTIGQTVFVSTLGSEGVVRSVSPKHVQVDVRGKRVRVAVAALRRAGAAGAGPSPPAASRPVPRISGPSPAGTGRELVVIGSTVDEAIDRAEKFLDAALLADERRLRVVHGHGTGRLREALTKFFRQHPLVASASPAADNEGGSGATIVELKD
jgi:DNA mismatch repair protein MutS2